MPKAVINLHVDLPILAIIDQIARDQGISRSQWIREACLRRIREEQYQDEEKADEPIENV